MLERACLKAGLVKHLTPHSLRHGVATHVVEAGIERAEVQRILGHARVETTKPYIHVANPRTRKVRSPL